MANLSHIAAAYLRDGFLGVFESDPCRQGFRLQGRGHMAAIITDPQLRPSAHGGAKAFGGGDNGINGVYQNIL